MKSEKENNLQKMLGANINLGVSYYEIYIAAKAGQGKIFNRRLKHYFQNVEGGKEK